MKIALSVTLIVLVFHNIHARARHPKLSEEELLRVCPELKETKWEFLFKISSEGKPYNGSKFYFGLKNKKDNDGLLEINSKSLSALENSGFRMKGVFDVSLKTIVIIHGYRSVGTNPWVVDMKDMILSAEDVNVILVDWSSGSYTYNYVDSVASTANVSQELSQLFFDLKSRISKFEDASSLWNHLYFIGHSLGAHISGQASHLLKQEDKFFKIERITGLDPARPCFKEAHSRLKLDKGDADFVDVLHTQTNQPQKKFGFGLMEPIGHVNFYLNGGVLQPACHSYWPIVHEFNDMICSHTMSHEYFMESYNNAENCKFEGHPWDRTYSKAVEILENVKNNKPCKGCLEIGKDVTNNLEKYGSYLVFTSAEEPYCPLKKGDFSKVEDKLKLLL